jgi:hypothetical protein
MITKDSSMREVVDYLHNGVAHVIFFIPASLILCYLKWKGKQDGST